MRSNTVVDPVAGGVAAAGTAVGALVETVRAGGLRAESHDELSARLGELRRLQARLAFVELAVVREVDARGSCVEDGARSTGAWARMHTRMNPGEAAAAVRTARVLGSNQLPGTAQALAAGEIDLAHVRAITAGVADAPAGAVALIEPEALAVARVADPRAVTGLMRRFIHALDPDGADAAALARYDRRGITLSPLPDGTVHIRGCADEVNGALLMTAIDAASPVVSGDRRSAAQRRIDGLAEISRKFLGSPDAPMSGGGHAHLIVAIDATTLTHGAGDNSNPDTDNNVTDADVVDAYGTDGTVADHTSGGGDGGADLAGRLTAGATDDSMLAGLGSEGAGASTGAGPGGTLSWVGPITGSTARRIGCDADVTYVAIDPDGGAEVIGREQRFFSWAQRKAMIARDGDRCIVPFCDRPVSWADAHHLQHWTLGGPTTIANGGLPCAGHHPMCHEGGWTLIRLPDSRYLFRHRNGKTIGPEPHPPGHNRPPPKPPP
jgi:hypothetical protein